VSKRGNWNQSTHTDIGALLDMLNGALPIVLRSERNAAGGKWWPDRVAIALVDTADYERVMDAQPYLGWYGQTRELRPYVRVPGKHGTPSFQCLKNFVMRVPRHTGRVEAINGDPFDCRRANLRVVKGGPNLALVGIDEGETPRVEAA
jgi:hypothetical protein